MSQSSASSPQAQPGLPFLKGHGTGNDFIVIDAVAIEVYLSADDVRAMCDRHKGIGADGVLRVAHAAEYAVSQAKYFMDYRNADGSVAETCGNGLRVFARFLIENGYESRGSFPIATRGGLVMATVRDDDADFSDVAITMGQPELIGADDIYVFTDEGSWPAIGVHMPNPHCVTVVDDINEAGDLYEAPTVTPEGIFPQGVNVEFIAEKSSTHVAMRTFERGVGETLSCGSGACAAGYVWAQHQGLAAPWTVQIDVLGGTVFVDGSTAGDLTLRGPAEFVAAGTYDQFVWLD